MVERAILALAAVALLTGCSKADDEAALGGKITQAESDALHDAGEMLEKGRPGDGPAKSP